MNKLTYICIFALMIYTVAIAQNMPYFSDSDTQINLESQKQFNKFIENKSTMNDSNENAPSPILSDSYLNDIKLRSEKIQRLKRASASVASSDASIATISTFSSDETDSNDKELNEILEKFKRIEQIMSN